MYLIQCISFSTWKVWHLSQCYSKVTCPKFPARLGRKNSWAIPNYYRCSNLIQTSNFSCTWFNVLGSVHEKFGIWINTAPKPRVQSSLLGLAGRMAEPFQIEIGVPNWFRHQTFHVQCTWFNVLGSAHEKVWHLNQCYSKVTCPNFPARLDRKNELRIEIGVPNWFRHQTFHVLDSMC